MNKRVKRLCELCREVDKAYIEYGALAIGGVCSNRVHLSDKAFFKYFDKYYKDETYQGHEYVKFYRIYDGVYFYCLVEKGDVDDE